MEEKERPTHHFAKKDDSGNTFFELFFIVHDIIACHHTRVFVYVIAWFGVKFGINHTSNVPRMGLNYTR